MPPTHPTKDAEALQKAGLLLPPVLETEHVRLALGLSSRAAVLRLHRREGLPLARVGRRYFVTRQLFQQWLDERTRETTRYCRSQGPWEVVPGGAT